jgi:hypothetical protein
MEEALIRKDENGRERLRRRIGNSRGHSLEGGVPRIQGGSGGRRFGAIAHDAGLFM